MIKMKIEPGTNPGTAEERKRALIWISHCFLLSYNNTQATDDWFTGMRGKSQWSVIGLWTVQLCYWMFILKEQLFRNIV